MSARSRPKSHFWFPAYKPDALDAHTPGKAPYDGGRSRCRRFPESIATRARGHRHGTRRRCSPMRAWPRTGVSVELRSNAGMAADHDGVKVSRRYAPIARGLIGIGRGGEEHNILIFAPTSYEQRHRRRRPVPGGAVIAPMASTDSASWIATSSPDVDVRIATLRPRSRFESSNPCASIACAASFPRSGAE